MKYILLAAAWTITTVIYGYLVTSQPVETTPIQDILGLFVMYFISVIYWIYSLHKHEEKNNT